LGLKEGREGKDGKEINTPGRRKNKGANPSVVFLQGGRGKNRKMLLFTITKGKKEKACPARFYLQLKRRNPEKGKKGKKRLVLLRFPALLRGRNCKDRPVRGRGERKKRGRKAGVARLAAYRDHREESRMKIVGEKGGRSTGVYYD